MKHGEGEEETERKTTTISSQDCPLTPKNLIDICSVVALDRHANIAKEKGRSRQERLDVIRDWHETESTLMESILFCHSDSKSGCFPLHWAAGTGFDEAVVFFLDHYSRAHAEACYSKSDERQRYNSTTNTKVHILVNQLAVKPSTGRTPLHYAARNGHRSTCQLLVDRYEADPNPKCHRGSVTPLQLSVWQNRLEIVQYLVSTNNGIHTSSASDTGRNNNIVLETNDFQCGLNHWIGLVPKHRWLSQDGSGVLSLARYLHQQGASFTSTPENQQNQGHTPLHKAAWGGNIALMEYFREEHDVYDSLQDACGNYAADLAQMGGQSTAQEWLHTHGSISRQESCDVLALPVTATNEDIQARYKLLARRFHPDKLQKATLARDLEEYSADDDAFVRIKAAYEHLVHQGGVGSQKNPKYEALRLLTSAKTAERNSAGGTEYPSNCNNRQVDLFHARILVIVSDYGDKGFPISAIAKRWNQIWPDRPFPTPENYIIEVPVIVGSREVTAGGLTTTTANLQTTRVLKRVKLLKFLKWKCNEVLVFRKINGVELAFQKMLTPTVTVLQTSAP